MIVGVPKRALANFAQHLPIARKITEQEFANRNLAGHRMSASGQSGHRKPTAWWVACYVLARFLSRSIGHPRDDMGT